VCRCEPGDAESGDAGEESFHGETPKGFSTCYLFIPLLEVARHRHLSLNVQAHCVDPTSPPPPTAAWIYLARKALFASRAFRSASDSRSPSSDLGVSSGGIFGSSSWPGMIAGAMGSLGRLGVMWGSGGVLGAWKRVDIMYVSACRRCARRRYIAAGCEMCS
jgi:hypothetical protein